jgi:transposase
VAATVVVETGEVQVRLLVVAGCLAGERRPVEAGAAGAEKTFRPYDPDQILLLAPCLQDWVPDGHLARFVSDLVDEALDLSAIYASYEDERGYPPYEPRLMVKLLVYGYATGTPSSCRLEERTQTDVAVRFLCADQHPDFRSIARFRRRHLDALAELFVQALRLCQRAGLVKLGTLALDGTKLRANASRRKAMSYERLARAERRLELEIEAMRAQARGLLSEAEAADAVEDERFGRDRRGERMSRSSWIFAAAVPV